MIGRPLPFTGMRHAFWWYLSCCRTRSHWAIFGMWSFANRNCCHTSWCALQVCRQMGGHREPRHCAVPCDLDAVPTPGHISCASSVCVFSAASSPPLPVLFLALEPANTRHIFLGFWVKIQSLVTIQVSLKVSLLPCLQSPHICPIVLVWLGSALATRLNWESKYLWLMWPMEHHIYSAPPPMTFTPVRLWLFSRPFCLSIERPSHAASSARVYSGLLALPRLTCPHAVECFFFYPL